MLTNKFSRICVLACAALSFLALTANAQEQTFDYAPHPKLDFSFDHLTLELNVDPEQQLLEGSATYEVRANLGGVDSLVLNAARMDVRDVQVGGNEVEFRLHNDSLFIALGETSVSGQQYRIDIFYEASPRFGVHFESNGTVWTSSLPLSTRHWLPVVDHPRVAFTTDITLVIPGSFSATAPGKRGAETIVSVDEKQLQWQSKRPIPASALWFAAGPFQSIETSFGIKQIQVTADSQKVEKYGKRLLETAYELLDETEDELGVEYPFETLNVVLLDDHRWETKPYAAGAVFLFGNRGNLATQLRRGIFAQWFGVLQREEQWSDAEAVNLYQTTLNQILMPEMSRPVKDHLNPDASVNPYHAFSVKHWNRWQRFYPQWEDTTWKRVIERNLSSELDKGAAVRAWDDYADSWYQDSGQPWFQPPRLSVEQEDTERDSIIYRVDYQYDEENGELILNFQAQDSVVTELITLPLVEYTGQQADTMQVTFTGKDDAVKLNLDPLVSYVSIDTSVRDDITLREYKPVPFILSQLRNTESVEEKTAAALQLGNHDENPDLQLAINDLLSQEQPPEVKAALLSSMGKITKGATGTEQQFLDALREENIAIKEAAVNALRHYQGNEQVIQSLQQVAAQSDTMPLFKKAVNSLLATVDSADTSPLISFSQRIMNRDTVGNKAVFVLEKMAQRDEIDREEIIKNLAVLINGDYSYPVRGKALEILKRVDTNEKEWTARIKNLLMESDPRIRFLAVQTGTELGFPEVTNLLNERLLDEYDGRIYYEMKKVTE